MKHIDKILFVIGAIAFGLSFLDSNDRQGLILGISFMLPLFINWFFELEIVERWTLRHWRLIDVMRQIGRVLLIIFWLLFVWLMALGTMNARPHDLMPFVVVVLAGLFTLYAYRHYFMFWRYRYWFFRQEKTITSRIDGGWGCIGQASNTWFKYKIKENHVVIAKHYLRLEPSLSDEKLRMLRAEVAQTLAAWPHIVTLNETIESDFLVSFEMKIMRSDLSKALLGALYDLCLRLEKLQYHGLYYFHDTTSFSGELWGKIDNGNLTSWVYRQDEHWWGQEQHDFFEYPDDLPEEVNDELCCYEEDFIDCLIADQMITEAEWKQVWNEARKQLAIN